MSSLDDSSLYKSVHIPGLTILTSLEMQAALEARLPGLPPKLYLIIVTRHSDLMTQATLLENEARGDEDEAAHSAKFGVVEDCPDEMAGEVDYLRDKVELLRQMRVCCVQKIKVLETGSIDEILQFFQQDDAERSFLETVCQQDPGIKENMTEVWPHLEFEGVRMLRLQLIWGLVEKDRTADCMLYDLGINLTSMDIVGKEREEMASLDLMMGKMKVEVGQEAQDEDVVM